MIKGFRKKVTTVFLCGMMIATIPMAHLGNSVYTVRAEDNNGLYYGYISNNESDAKNVGINVAYRTPDEIREFIRKHPADFSSVAQYEEKPLGTPPYSLGKLKQRTLQSALNTVNQIRYIAGLSSNVVLNDKYTKLAQGASVVSAVNRQISHYPSRPYGMSDSLYRIGAEGAGHSNLAMGYDNIDMGIIYGYMNDGDPINIDKIGHRRWILNPTMKAVGFGFYNYASATYAHDGALEYSPKYGVAWPARNMPLEYFNSDFPWSISMGYEVNAADIKVELTRLMDNKTWRFSRAQSDGYFNVDNTNYGLSGCIIFRPNGIDKYVNGDRFRVKITGLSKPLIYEVSFFDLVSVSDISLDKIPKRIKLGQETKLSIKTVPENASNVVKIDVDGDVLKLNYGKSGGIFEYDYERYCSANTYGTATITVSTPDGSITKSKKVTIVPPNVHIYSSVSTFSRGAKRGKLELFVSKDNTVSGYEVVFAKNKKFQNSKKMVSNSPKMTKFMINKAHSGRTYYVKARAFVKIGGKKIYGDYSRVRKYKAK